MKDGIHSADWSVSATSLDRGVWTARLEGAAEMPKLEAVHRHKPLPGLKTEPAGTGVWTATVALPSEILADGLETVHLIEKTSGVVLASLNISAGRPVPTDMAAELTLLRDELEMLKRAFRRRMAE